MDYTRPFVLRAADAEPRAVLLIHGFTGSPYELHLLGQHLYHRGHHCAAPLLAGHHSSLEALTQTQWPDWLKSAEEALHALWKTVSTTAGRPRLAVVGLSMGGLLALELARRYPAEHPLAPTSQGGIKPAIAALCVLAAPLFLPKAQTRLIRSMSRLPILQRLSVPKLFGADLRERNRPRPPLRPGGMPIRCLDSLLDLMEEVRGHLNQVTQPTLLCHGLQDHTAPFGSMPAIAAALATPKAALRCLALPRSYHLLPLDVERQLLFEEVDAHLQRFLPFAPTENPR
jgi:carboxylesterase